MKTKAELIADYLAIPIKVGDEIIVKGENFKNKDQESWEKVAEIDSEHVYYYHDASSQLSKRKIQDVVKNAHRVGIDPFKPELRMDAYQVDIEQLFWRGGYDKWVKTERMEKYFGVSIPEICLNPIVIDKNGNEVEYQRGLVWTLEQKQLLIESIYNNIEIGKFVFRRRKFEWVEKRVKAGLLEHTAFMDLVDGKQRFTTLVDFYTDKFHDMNGVYFSELSDKAQRKFTGYRQLTYVELDEKSTDQDALNVFLAINFTGLPMSKEHIEYVKTIKV